MKAISLFSILIVVLLFLSGGCSAASKATVTFDELISNAEKYNGKTVTVDGIYVSSFEATVLAGNIQFTPNGESEELTTVGSAIWFAGFLPQEVRDKLYAHTSPDAGVQHYAKVRVTGMFESGGKYGNLHEYHYRITASKVQFLDWTPPK
jgi:hypothetical protein